MLSKKICMLGSSAVGKTSLVHRFAQRAFSDKYLTTIGVRIEKKEIALDGQDLVLLLWDLEGRDEQNQVRLSHLRGASGYLLVVDGTRRPTFDVACAIQDAVEQTIKPVPFLFIVNKTDLLDDWQVDDEMLQSAADRGWTVCRTSAKLGDGVEEAFHQLARRILA